VAREIGPRLLRWDGQAIASLTGSTPLVCLSATDRPSPEHDMPGLTKQAVHEDKLARGPADRLDSSPCDTTITVEQGHVRRTEVRLAPKPRLGHGRCQHSLARHEYRNIIIAAQDEGQIAWSSTESPYAVEGDFELRHLETGCDFACRSDDIIRQSDIIANVVQRDVQTFQLDRLASQPELIAQFLSEPRYVSGSF
jgi:hypothetical protein